MDLISDLLPAVPSLLDPTSQYLNVTLLTDTFIGAFLGTFIASLASQTVRHVLGESDILCHFIQHSFIQILPSDEDQLNQSESQIFYIFIPIQH